MMNCGSIASTVFPLPAVKLIQTTYKLYFFSFCKIVSPHKIVSIPLFSHGKGRQTDGFSNVLKNIISNILLGNG